MNIRLVAAAILAWSLVSAGAAQPSLESGSVTKAAERLQPGEFLWAPEVAPRGPVLLVVSLATQRAVIYRNGLPIGITTVSTGRPGYRTPTGVFTILQRRVEHYSNLYNNAPMPFMQRLTWGGVALHAGDLPGYPASHGCIRLPREFARLLYGITHMGMTVVITDQAVVPRLAPAQILLGRPSAVDPSRAGISWNSQASPSGPISIVVSAADRRVVVLRNGVVIGTSPVEIDARVERTSAFVLQAGGTDPVWLRVPLPGQNVDPQAPPELRGRIHVPEDFRRSVEAILEPGTTVVVTPDPLGTTSSEERTVIEADGAPDQARP
jgi:hypothetical protein